MNECIENIANSMEECLKIKLSDVMQSLKRDLIKSIQHEQAFSDFYTDDFGKLTNVESSVNIGKYLDTYHEWIVHKDYFDEEFLHYICITNAGTVIYEQPKSTGQIMTVEYDTFRKYYDEQYKIIQVPHYHTGTEAVHEFKMDTITGSIFSQCKHDDCYDIIIMRGVCPLSNEIIKCMKSVYNGFLSDKSTTIRRAHLLNRIVDFWMFVCHDLSTTWKQVKIMKTTEAEHKKHDDEIELAHWRITTSKDAEISELKRRNKQLDMKLAEFTQNINKLQLTIQDLEKKHDTEHRYSEYLLEKSQELENFIKKHFGGK